MVAAGYDNGDVKLLDLRMNALVWQTNVSNGVAGLEFDRKDIEANKLVRRSEHSVVTLTHTCFHWITHDVVC